MTNPNNEKLILRPTLGATEYPQLVDIWRGAVQATHDFLSDEDFTRIEGNLVPHYFPAVSLLVAEIDGVPVGFAGTAEGNLEMLFVSDDVRGQGIGTALLEAVIANDGVVKVDVNEQNTGATGFYLSKGFEVDSRSDVDDDGRPYPVLHLKLA